MFWPVAALHGLWVPDGQQAINTKGDDTKFTSAAVHGVSFLPPMA